MIDLKNARPLPGAAWHLLDWEFTNFKASEMSGSGWDVAAWARVPADARSAHAGPDIRRDSAKADRSRVFQNLCSWASISSRDRCAAAASNCVTPLMRPTMSQKARSENGCRTTRVRFLRGHCGQMHICVCGYTDTVIYRLPPINGQRHLPLRFRVNQGTIVLTLRLGSGRK